MFVKQASGELSRMEEAPYEAEEVLQKLLVDYPDLLSGDSADTDTRWLLVEREIGIAAEPDGSSRWSLDHLFLDREGVPTLVEVKRAAPSGGRSTWESAEIRRGGG